MSLNVCRARDGLGHVVLPSNYSRLSAAEQLLVLVDLERVNRGEAPLAGLTAAMDKDASIGASLGEDPPFHPSDLSSDWAGGSIEGDMIRPVLWWVYDDGYGSANLACTNPTSSGCWGHRDSLLTKGSDLAAGAAIARGGDSVAFQVGLVVPGTRLVFSWAGELRFFGAAPRREPAVSALLAGHVLSDGSSLTAVSGDYLELGTDGILRLCAANGVVRWRSAAGRPGDRLVLERGGNLVLESGTGALFWDTGTNGHIGDRLVIEPSGSAELLSPSRAVIWRA